MGTPMMLGIIERGIGQQSTYKISIIDPDFLGMEELSDGPWLNTIEDALDFYLLKFEQEKLIDDLDRNSIFEE
jgi:hypothetical protein